MGPRCSTRSERSRPVLVQPDLADRGGQMGAQAAADMTPLRWSLTAARAWMGLGSKGCGVGVHLNLWFCAEVPTRWPRIRGGWRRTRARLLPQTCPAGGAGHSRAGLGSQGRPDEYDRGSAVGVGPSGAVPCRCRARRPDQRSCFIRYGFAVSDKSDPLADCLPRAVDRGEGSGCLARRQTSQRRSAHHPGDSVADARGRARFTGSSPCVVVPRHFRFGRRPPQWLDHRARRRDGRLTRANVTTPLASTPPSGPRPGARRWVCQPSRRLLS